MALAVALTTASLLVTGPGAGATDRFADVPDDHIFHDDIAWLADGGWATGFPDGTYRPDEPITRGTMVALLWRLTGEPAGPYPAPPASDVDPDATFATAIAWGYDEGVLRGYPDGTLRPTSAVSRQAMVALLHRLSGLDRTYPAPTFKDVTVAHPFRSALAFADATNLAGAYRFGRFYGDLPVTRGSLAAFLHRFVTMTGGSWPVGIHDHHGGHPCMPTEEQQATADQLVEDVKASLARFPTVTEATAAGYVYVAPPFNGVGAHYIQPEWLQDGEVLNPLKPESIMVASDGAVEGAMFLMEQVGQPGPMVGGCLTRWHLHDNLCYSAPAIEGGSVVGLTDWGCPDGSMLMVSPEMLHVWVVPRPGGPFEGLET